MPCRFRYFPQRHLLIQHFSGVLCLSEVLAFYDRVLSHPALPDTRYELTDMRCVSLFGIDRGTMANLVVMLSAEYLRRLDTFRRGAVIVGTSSGESAARMFQDALPTPVRPCYGLFRDSAAALAWLNLGRTTDAAQATPPADWPFRLVSLSAQ